MGVLCDIRRSAFGFIKQHIVAISIVALIIIGYAIYSWYMDNHAGCDIERNPLFQEYKMGYSILSPFTQRQESFFPQYERELDLFQSLSIQEQQEYLNLSKEEKLAKYGNKL